MANIDLCMMTTSSKTGEMNSRPMSNNGDVEYDGDSFFFTSEDTGKVRDIKANPAVNLSFRGKDNVFISVEGQAELIKDKSEMKDHWTKDLDEWFKEGIDTPGIVMIKVKGEKARYWDGMDSGDVDLAS